MGFGLVETKSAIRILSHLITQSIFIKKTKRPMIQAIGRYLPLDENGFLQNDCAWEKVPLHWQELVEETKNHYLNNLGDTVHSIYLRGSVPAGIAIDGVADLDTFALVKNSNKSWAHFSWGKKLENELLQKYPFAKGIEIVQSGISPNGELSNLHLAPILKLQSICLWGESVLPALPAYRPGPELLRNYRWIKEDLIDLLLLPTNSEDFKSALKTILRTGFELVMEREQKFTTDLYPCWKSFAQYYPEWEGEMEKVLLYILEPPKDKRALQELADGLGNFLIEEVKNRC